MVGVPLGQGAHGMGISQGPQCELGFLNWTEREVGRDPQWLLLSQAVKCFMKCSIISFHPHEQPPWPGNGGPPVREAVPAAQQMHESGTGASSSQQHLSPTCPFLSFSKGLLSHCDQFGAFLCGQQPGFEEPWKVQKCFIYFRKRVNRKKKNFFFSRPLL